LVVTTAKIVAENSHKNSGL